MFLTTTTKLKMLTVQKNLNKKQMLQQVKKQNLMQREVQMIQNQQLPEQKLARPK